MIVTMGNIVMNEQTAAWQDNGDQPPMPLLIAVPEAARLLGIGATLAWELVRLGRIPSIKLGRRVLVPRAGLERLAHVPTSADMQDVEATPAQYRPATTGGGNVAQLRPQMS